MNYDAIRRALPGYAVILVSPEALSGLHPTDAEDAAWAAIDSAIERYEELIREDEEDEEE